MASAVVPFTQVNVDPSLCPSPLNKEHLSLDPKKHLSTFGIVQTALSGLPSSNQSIDASFSSVATTCVLLSEEPTKAAANPSGKHSSPVIEASSAMLQPTGAMASEATLGTEVPKQSTQIPPLLPAQDLPSRNASPPTTLHRSPQVQRPLQKQLKQELPARSLSETQLSSSSILQQQQQQSHIPLTTAAAMVQQRALFDGTSTDSLAFGPMHMESSASSGSFGDLRSINNNNNGNNLTISVDLHHRTQHHTNAYDSSDAFGPSSATLKASRASDLGWMSRLMSYFAPWTSGSNQGASMFQLKHTHRQHAHIVNGTNGPRHAIGDSDAIDGPATTGLFSFLTPESIKVIGLCLLWYASSAASNNVAKQIMVEYKFPVTLTYVQFGFVGVFCFLFGYFAGDPVASMASLPTSSRPFDSTSTSLRSAYSLMDWQPPRALFNSVGGLWRRIMPFHAIRKFVHFVFVGIVWVVGTVMTVLHRTIILLRFWVALGLGIYDDPQHFHQHHVRPGVRFFSGTRIRVPCKDVVMMMMPLSGFLISGHIFSSVAISHVPVSFVHTIKALAPLFTVLVFRFMYNTVYSERVYISLIPLTLGVMLSCSFELSFNFIGLFCALASTWIFVGQNIFSKGLFKERKLDKLNMLLYSSSSSFLLMTPIWFWSEGCYMMFGVPASSFLPFVGSDPDAPKETHYPSWMIFTLFVINGITHFGQNVFAFSILSLVTPVTYSIASLIKRIVVIVVSMIWFGQQVSMVQGVGVVLTFCGLWMYQGAKMATADGGIHAKASPRASDEPTDRQEEVVFSMGATGKPITTNDRRQF